MKTFFFLTAGIAISMALIGVTRGGYEKPEYTVVMKDGDVEIRAYESLSLVTAPMDTAESTKNEKSQEKKGDSSFMMLFGYISGKNSEGEKISMTSPVFVDVSDPNDKKMSFMIPTDVASEGAPKPSNESVDLTKISAGKFIAMRFKGYRNREKEMKALATLRAWADEKGIKTDGGPLFAYYDPPWTPEFMRRNEVMIRLAPDARVADAR